MTTLMEALRSHSHNLDLHDATVGYPRCWDVDPDPDHEDVFTLVQRYLAERIEVDDVRTVDGFACVYGEVWEFCEENLDVLEEFSIRWNRDCAQIDDSMAGLYHAVTTVQQLASGDYPVRAYEWLCDRWSIWEVA